MSVQSLTSQSPHTKEKAVDRFINQLLELRRGQNIKVHLEDCAVPDFHSEDNVYEVIKTVAPTSKNGEESHFKIFLGSDQVNSMSDPVFKIVVSRSVPNEVGMTRPEAEWGKHWMNVRTGKDRWGNNKWKQLHGNPEDITIVADVEWCSECGRPL